MTDGYEAQVPLFQQSGYRNRTNKQWQYMWEHSIQGNPPMHTAYLAADRKVEAIANMLSEDERAREVTGAEIRKIIEEMGLGSYIIGHSEGWIEAWGTAKQEVAMAHFAVKGMTRILVGVVVVCAAIAGYAIFS